MLVVGLLSTLTHATLVAAVFFFAVMETRAQAKQQELQDQISKLLSMMETQHQRREQLAAESQHHLTQPQHTTEDAGGPDPTVSTACR